MARPLRIEFEDAIYHLCARGNARQPVFRDERDCARFLKLLSESAQRFEAAVLCFVLMGNHFHLVACAEAARSAKRFAQAAPGNYLFTQSGSIH